MQIAILHNHVPEGAPQDELDNLVQVRAIEQALQSLGHEVAAIPVGLDLSDASSAVTAANAEVLFNLVESINGCGRYLYLGGTLCEVARLPFTGCPTQALLITTDKLQTKRLLARAGLPTAPWLDPESGKNTLAAIDTVIVKPVHEDASVGLDDAAVLRDVSPARVTEELASRRRRFGFAWFAERFIEGREFNISILGRPREPRLLPHAEIRFIDFPEHKPRFVGYAAKWDEHSFEYLNTKRAFDFSPEDAALLDELSTLTRRAWQELGLSGYARVDFRVDQDGNPWILEVNANPCIAPDSGFASAAERAGMSYVEMVETILECANEHE